ncbi:ComEC/Rec2 family competence protein [Halosquirtibacter laminarini]|uniref:ComEC/Rec2 family competence protein n=1 Tax=Halosquirtibacter laminarini TaxID=3374600 RepID=A0AC61NQY6_9BACT|nr:ComEC/Rec2 family competence protein [Prolixibacteraceae bacterium]
MTSKPAPIISLCIMFSFGLIAVAYQFNHLAIIIGIGCILLLLFMMQSKSLSLQYILLHLGIFTLGYLHYPNNLFKMPEKERCLLKVIQKEKEGKHSNAYLVELLNSQTKIILITRRKHKINKGEIISANIQPFKKKICSVKNNDRYQHYLHSKNIVSSYYGYYIKKISTNNIPHTHHPLKEFVARQWNNEVLTEEQSALYNALLLGDRSKLERDKTDLFRRLGISHVLAMSGLHISIIWTLIMLILFPLRKLYWGKKIAMILSGVAVLIYVNMIHVTPSLERATWMLLIGILFTLSSKQKSPLHIWSLIVCIILIIKPYIITSVSFQLSIAAVLGIIYFVPMIESKMYKNKTSPMIIRMILASVGAQIATFPLVLYYFNQWNPLSIIWNLIAIPFVTLEIYSGFILLLLPHNLDLLLSNIINRCTEIFFNLCHYIDSIFPHGLQSFNINILQSIILLFTIIVLSIPLRKQYRRGCIYVLLVVWAIVIPIPNSRPIIVWKNNATEHWVMIIKRDRAKLWVKPTQTHPNIPYYKEKIIPFLTSYQKPFSKEITLSIDSTSIEENGIIEEYPYLIFINDRYPRSVKIFQKDCKTNTWTIENIDQTIPWQENKIFPSQTKQLNNSLSNYITNQ